MSKQTVRDIDVKGKKVLVRVDFNVPLKDGKVADDNRIEAALPTIKYLLEQDAKIILLSHLGKVDHKDPEKTEKDKAKNNMAPVAEKLQEKVDARVIFVDTTRGEQLDKAVEELKEGEIILVQNTRYEKGESKNDPELAKYWASLADVFVSDAFGSVHRAHASTVGVADYLDSASGFLVAKEIDALSSALDNPQRPFVAILGGAKVSDKIGLIEHLLDIADKVIIGGGMAYTFAKAKGYEVGTSLLEEDKVELAKEIMEKGKDKLVLPVDTVVAKEFNETSDSMTVSADGIPADYMGLDIGPKTIELFREELQGAKTVVWNGPMGVFEMDKFATGTLEIAKAIVELEEANTIIGGGDSAAAAIKLGFKDKFSHISTGGGASMEFLEGKELPGVAAIKDKE